MKFALRDDDLNYFFTPEIIKEYYDKIWDFCPVSMSAVPFIKGNWPEEIEKAKKIGPGFINEAYLRHLIEDNRVFPIHENIELVSYINDQIKKRRVYITIHGIHHRNEDDEIPQFKDNFGFGAEFYTSRDLTNELKNAIGYLEKTFSQSIKVFTPPQNGLNNNGLNAVLNNNLCLCADFPSIKRLDTLTLFGLNNYVKYSLFKLKNRKHIYPFVITNRRISIVNHQRLQPGIDIARIKNEIDFAHAHNGLFVLSTHSYGFNYLMEKGNITMGDAMIEIVNYAKQLSNVEFVNLNQIFE
jgi:predicted deacetylase